MTLSKEELETWLPTYCPAWCDRTHAQALSDGCGPEASREHFSGAGGHIGFQIRNRFNGRVHRDGGISWDLDIRQQVFTEPLGALGECFVDLSLSSFPAQGMDRETAHARLTTGEARVLAAQLLRAADRMDLT